MSVLPPGRVCSWTRWTRTQIDFPCAARRKEKKALVRRRHATSDFVGYPRDCSPLEPKIPEGAIRIKGLDSTLLWISEDDLAGAAWGAGPWSSVLVPNGLGLSSGADASIMETGCVMLCPPCWMKVRGEQKRTLQGPRQFAWAERRDRPSGGIRQVGHRCGAISLNRPFAAVAKPRQEPNQTFRTEPAFAALCRKDRSTRA